MMTAISLTLWAVLFLGVITSAFTDTKDPNND